MPNINLPNNGLNSQYLHAMMVYPNDIEARESLIAVSSTYHFVESNVADEVQISKDILIKLTKSGSYKSESRNGAIQAAYGQIAGNILINLSRMQLYGYPEPSFGKAVRLVERYNASAKNSEYMSAPASEPKLKEYYRKFLPVIHFWAAYNICKIPNTANYLENFEIHDPNNMQIFLGVADWFRNFAVTFTPSRQPTKRSNSKPLIDANILFTFDKSFLTKPPEITWHSLDDWMLEELNSYTSSF